MAPTISTLVSDNPTVQTDPMAYDANAAPHACDPGEKADENGPVSDDNKEWTMLLKLSTAACTGNVNIVKIHQAIFDLLHSSDPSLYFKTQTGLKITSSKDFPKGTDYETTFQHKETRKIFIVAHTVGSARTIDELKRNNPPLLAYLKENNVFLDLSVSGSLTEVVLGPWFGIHPDFTSKERLRFDLVKLIACHGMHGDGKFERLEAAKTLLPFSGGLPPFQLRTRRIQRTVDSTEYSAKTTSFICASEHRDFWEKLLVDGMASGWLAPLGRFYLLQRDDHSDDLISGIIWHNRMLTKMKAIIIRGVHTHIMDAAVRAPHSMEERPTLREQIHKGGFITILSTKDRSKWIGIAQNAETASNWVNKNMQALCASVYTDGTAPVATDPEPKIRKPRPSRGFTDEKSALFDRQSKSWADITRHDQDADSGNFTSSSIAKRVPNVVRFQSKVRFDIVDVLVPSPKPDDDDDTKMTTTDGLTMITQDDLRTMKDELSAQFKDELSSAISEMSNNSEARTSNDKIQSAITDQINQHNIEMHETMKSMRSMMQSMQSFVEATLATKPDDDSSICTPFRDSRQNLSDTESPSPPNAPGSPLSNLLTQPTKRNRTPVSKGQSPISKLAHTGGGRNGGRGRGGRGRTSSRSPPRRSTRNQNQASAFNPSEFDAQTNTKFDPMEISEPKQIRRQPFAAPPSPSTFAAPSSNQYDPLAESDAQSTSGSN